LNLEKHNKPCLVLYDTDLLERLSGGRKGVMAHMVARDTLPDSAVVGWLQNARLDSVQGRLAMESLARCLAGDSLFCPPRSGVPAPTGRPFPVTIPERSLHVLEVRRCPDNQPAAKGRRLARAVVWRW
jgi:hypothetical protein